MESQESSSQRTSALGLLIQPSTSTHHVGHQLVSAGEDPPASLQQSPLAIQHQPSYHGGILPGASGVTISSSTLVAQTTQTSNSLNVLNLLKPNIATSALYNSSERFDPPKCDEGTRIELIEELSRWTKDKVTTQRILCMTGPAGSGKSALQQTMVERCAENGSLLAAFFFYSQDARRNSTKRVIPTIAYQVGRSIPACKEPIIRAVEGDVVIFDRNIHHQMQRLIVEPIREALSQPGVSPELLPRNIFIDGIDECKGEHNQAFLLRVVQELVLAFSHDNFGLKVCLAGRPEYALRTALGENGHLKESELLYHIELSDHDATSDIQLFLERKLRAIARATTYPLPSTRWPSEEDIQRLVDNASGQFIYPATIVKYLSDRRRSPVKQLQMILEWRPGAQHRDKPFAALDALYTDIFVKAGEAYATSKGIDDNLCFIRHIRRLLKINIGIRVTVVEELLSLDPGELEIIFSDLHSVTRTFWTGASEGDWLDLTFHHKSVKDFLQDPARCGPLFLPSAQISFNLIQPCIAWLTKQQPLDVDNLILEKETGGPHMTAYYHIQSILTFLGTALEEALHASDEEQLSHIRIWCSELRAHRTVEAFGRVASHKDVAVLVPSTMHQFLARCHERGLTSKSRHPEWVGSLRHLQKVLQCGKHGASWDDTDSEAESLKFEDAEGHSGRLRNPETTEVQGTPEVVQPPSNNDGLGDRREQTDGKQRFSLRRSVRGFSKRLRAWLR
ncbi:hypothetical protein FA15DRAFT_672416 [Coprinopsis marcescibilis]|uniref:Nephrocystin 3-like N-terminal domain-containing protein n=1 Tax=Coprinopsis marcescibilis TaxID=230819 RepID=A0A5C3KMW7_COPMA|nr:hypothetical protein FA15DRAFT_672416 [Coprinopsis marcescibilis]